MTDGPFAKVLAVDDDPTLLVLLEAALSQDAFAVTVTNDGEEALRLLKSSSFDIVLLDVEMPGRSGFEICESIRQTHGADMPVIMITGHDDLSSIDKAYHSGATDFVSKPINWALLGYRLRYVLRTFDTVRSLNEADTKLRLAASVFVNSYEGMIITDSRNVIIDVNPAFSRITGFSREESIGKTPKILTSGHHNSEFYANMRESLEIQDFWQGEIWNRRKNGDIFPEMLSISAVRDADGNVQNFTGIFSDISMIKTYEAELQRVAYYDMLTGVPNRRLLADRLTRATARARRYNKSLAVCYLDLDEFKPVNDKFGHAAGDQLLITVTERLRTILRAEDTLARLGGDEFVLLFTDLVQFDETLVVLDRILGTISRPVQINGTEISVSASIGVTLFPADDSDDETLLRHADQAMYRAKEEGKNRYCFFEQELHHKEINEQNAPVSED